MLRTLRIALARHAYLRAAAALNAYQSQPAAGLWRIEIAYALGLRADRLALRLANIIAR